MDDVIEKLVTLMANGGPGGIIAMLIIVVIALILDRRNLVKSSEKKDEKIDKIVEDFHKGNISITEAMNGVKMVLVEIKAKL